MKRENEEMKEKGVMEESKKERRRNENGTKCLKKTQDYTSTMGNLKQVGTQYKV